MRHRSIALPLAALAMFLFASAAAAGGWAQVSAPNPPVDPPVGEETTIQLHVLQHGITPVSWPALTVVATDSASGVVVRAKATASGAVGSYVATLVFPSAGNWTLTFSSPNLVMEGSASLQVAPAVVPAPAGPGTAEQQPTPAPPAADALAVALVLLVLAAGLGIVALVARARRAVPDTQVSAGT
jgi:hypothetical protein